MQFNKRITKHQEGGAAPAPEQAAPAASPEQGAPAEGAAQDPMMQLIQLAQQAIQGQDCQAGMAVCQGLISLVQQMQGGGEAPAPEQQGAPVFQKGGKLVRRINK